MCRRNDKSMCPNGSLGSREIGAREIRARERSEKLAISAAWNT
jgi:hypothetical protein